MLSALHGDVLPPADGVVAFTRREPFGVTAHITPWNYPLQMLAPTVAPALAAGNCCVLKPAEDGPVTAVEVARLAHEAGFPAGLFNVVPGLGTEAGAALAAHPGIDHVSFTGSRPVGASIATAAAANVVPVVLELGGKSPEHRLRRRRPRPRDPADRQRHHPERGPDLLGRVPACWSGEPCTTSWWRASASGSRRCRSGRGLDDPDLGPLIYAKQRDRVAEMVDRARARRASW